MLDPVTKLKPVWLLPEGADAEVAALAAQADLELPAARVLWRRGVRTPEAARKFLNPSLEDLLDPFLLADAARAAARLRQAVAARERILLYGDYDVDGAVSIVILKKVLEMAGADVRYHVPNRMRDGYGMNEAAIREAAAAGVRLIVSVDTGIRALDVVRLAGELGIDVIISDHHLPELELPPAFAVVNPNRPDCPYPEKNLCGAGVALKLIQGLMRMLEWPEARQRQLTDSLLKLVAIATVADVVPLVGENRVIVRRGLDGLGQTNNPGLRALMNVAGFGEGDIPTAGQVAFRIAPRMNAAGRMADANEVVELFLTDEPGRAEAIARQLHELNQERQRVESEIRRDIERACLSSPIREDQYALVFSGENWHKGVVGIVASRIVDLYHRPAFVLSEDPRTGLAQGSGRSIPAFPLLEALESMKDLFVRFGGHAQAAGVTLAWDRVAEFRRRLNACAAARLRPEDLRPVMEIDAAVDLGELTPRAIAELLDLAPFGQGNPTPRLLLRSVSVPSAPAVVKAKHLFFSLARGGQQLPVKAWNMAPRREELEPQKLYDAIVMLEPSGAPAGRDASERSAVLADIRPAGQVESAALSPQQSATGGAPARKSDAAAHEVPNPGT